MQRLALFQIALLAGLCVTPSPARGQSPVKYPVTRRDPTADTYFGTRVTDPYRWLEDQNSKEVATWVDGQNKVTFDYLATIPLRAMFKKELTKLINVPRVST